MKDTVWKRDEPLSPCTKVCSIHPQARICVGCLRSMDEIAGWARFTDAERQTIMETLGDRTGLLKKRRGGRAGRQGSQPR